MMHRNFDKYHGLPRIILHRKYRATKFPRDATALNILKPILHPLIIPAVISSNFFFFKRQIKSQLINRPIDF